MTSPSPADEPAASRTAPTAGAGWGPLSAAAQARLARPSTGHLAMPAMDDATAVGAWRRQVHDAWLDGDPSAEECGHREVTIGGVRCLVTGSWPPGGEPVRPLLVYCHGGGYALGSPETALPITERLAAGVDVVSIDYRLAPEHPHPAGLDDCRAVWAEVSSRTPASRSLILGGDSAGANMALSVALAAHQEQHRAPSGLVMFSPHLDHARAGITPAAPHPLDDTGPEQQCWLRDAYRGELDPGDPRVSPLWAELAGLPPLFIQAGGNDSALVDAVRVARRARLSGVLASLDVWPGLWHAWHYHRDLPEADLALAEALAVVRRWSAPPGG
ncbi:MAG: alpha/beta hydrolase [Actinomycetota bacterium]